MERKIKLGIIGIGNIGSIHAKKIYDRQCPDFELVAVADLDPERLEWAKEAFGSGVVLFDDAEKMLDSKMIDACIVSVPHYEHTKYAIACMQRGIHVMVEKPAGVFTREVEQMNNEADQHPEVVFGMMFNQRTNHIYRKLKEMIDSGVYGNIRRVNWIITNWYRPQAYYNSGKWRATWAGEGGGVLLNQCPHQLDLWQWLCGMPVKVHAHLHYGKWHDIEVEDDVTVYVEYPNGATGVFITTTGDACGTNRLEIQMDKARIIAQNDVLEVTEYEMTEQEFSAINTSPFGAIHTKQFTAETDGENPQHIGVINAWGGAILRKEPLIADGREGINGLMLSNAMHLSSWLGKAVELPIDADLYYEELMKRVATSKQKKTVVKVIAEIDASYAGSPTGEYKARWNTNW